MKVQIELDDLVTLKQAGGIRDLDLAPYRQALNAAGEALHAAAETLKEKGAGHEASRARQAGTIAIECADA